MAQRQGGQESGPPNISIDPQLLTAFYMGVGLALFQYVLQ